MTGALLYGFCISQAPLMLTLVLYFKEPTVTIYTTKVSNHTDVWVDSEDYGMGLVFVVASVAVFMFGVVTAQLKERGVIDNLQSYDDETMENLGMWTGLLWLVYALSHVLLTVRALIAADLYLLGLAVGGQLDCLTRMCRPASTLHSLWTVFYLGFAGIVWGALEHGVDSALWVIMVMLDMLLVVGHVHDASPNLQTIGNCRVVFCVGVSCLLLVSYVY